MQTRHHLSTRWAEAGYGSSLAPFAIMIVTVADVCNVATFGKYNANTSYIFPIGYWYEFTIAIVALFAGIGLAAFTLYERRR